MSNKALEIIIDSLSANLVEKDRVENMSQERIEQYKQIFSSDVFDDSEYKSISFFDKFHQVFTRYIDELLEANDMIGLKSQIDLVPVESYFHSSIAYKMGRKSVVIIDIISMQFIWMMNKTLIYSQDELSKRILFTEIFLHFGTLLKSDRLKGAYRKPKTPPHLNEQLFNILTTATEIQEKFLLSHEIAHLLLTEENINEFKTRYSSFTFEYTKGKAPQNIDIELAADHMALKMVLNDLTRKYPIEITDFSCVYIFLLIRYFMWLQIASSMDDSEEKNELFLIWSERNTQLRKIFREEIQRESLNLAILELFDDLESTMEPAAIAANEIIKNYFHINGVQS